MVLCKNKINSNFAYRYFEKVIVSHLLEMFVYKNKIPDKSDSSVDVRFW